MPVKYYHTQLDKKGKERKGQDEQTSQLILHVHVNILL